MTLIAVLQQQGHPFLIGDLLITQAGGPARSRKKIHILRSNLAVAWTGTLTAAGAILAHLFRDLPETPTRADVLTSLARHSRASLNNLELRLLGAIIDPKGTACFQWDASSHDQLSYGECFYDGSASALIRWIAGPHRPQRITEQTASARLRLVEREAMVLIGYLVADELGEQFARQLSAGLAYEAVFYDGSAFVYLDDMAFVLVDATFDNEGKCSQVLRPVYMRLRQVAGVLICDLIKDGEGQSVRDIIAGLHTPVGPAQTRTLIEPVGSTTPLWPQAPSISYVLMRLDGPKLACPGTVPLIILRGDKRSPVHVTCERSDRGWQLAAKVPVWVLTKAYRVLAIEQQSPGA